MKKSILILLVTVFCGFQLAEAQTVEITAAPTKTEVKADTDKAVKLSKTNSKSMKAKGCCASKMGAKNCSKSASATTVSNGKYKGKKACSPKEKAACERSKVKMASNEGKAEEEVKSSVQ